jgi:3,4-dihydroxyphenylacetate 2,3-dioxygenase
MIETPERTPFNIVRSAHVELVVTDLERSKEFYVDLLGFVLTEQTADALYLRGYEELLHHSLVLRLGSEPHLDHLAYRVWSPDDLPLIAAHFEALDCPVAWVEAGAEAGQGPSPALRVQDQLGFPLEFFHDMAQAERLLQRFDLHRGARIMRLDHFNLSVPDAEVGYEQYRRLGFRLSELIETEDGRLCAAWLYRKPTVHDVAFTTALGPRLHHLGFTTDDSQCITRLCDSLAGAGRDAMIERGPGRHGVSNAFFVYLRDPDGHRIELYTGDYYTGDPDFRPLRWLNTDPRRRTYWGHAVPDCWYDEATPVGLLGGGIAELQQPVLDERVAAVH